MKNGKTFLEGNATTCILKALKTRVSLSNSTCMNTACADGRGRTRTGAEGTQTLQTGLTGRTHALCGPQAPATAHLPWKQQHSTFTFIDNILNVWQREGFFFFFKRCRKKKYSKLT